jgi:hypothetical protein
MNSVNIGVLLDAEEWQDTEASDVDKILERCGRNLGLDPDQLYLAHMVPVTQGEALSSNMACVVKGGGMSMEMIEETLQRNRRLEEKVARSADALAALTHQIESNEATILQLESRLSRQADGEISGLVLTARL